MTTQDIKLSIVIPTYNSQNTIIRTLNSIEETIKNKFEIIIIDDCSKDNTLQILNEYIKKKSNIKIFSLLKNSGPGVARDKGLTYVTGKYTLFFDSDDIMRKYTVDNTITFLEKNNIDVGVMLYSVKSSCDQNDTGMWDWDNRIYNETKNKFGSIFDIKKMPLFLTVSNYPWNKICRTKFLLDHKITFGDLRLHEDILPHWMILTNSSKIYLSKEIICDYILDTQGSNVTNISNKSRLQCITALNLLYSFLKENSDYKTFIVAYWIFTARLLIWAKSIINTDYQHDIIDAAQAILFNMSIKDAFKIYHYDRDTYDIIYDFITNKLGY